MSERNFSSDRYFYMHVHKTGGTSVNALLDNIFSSDLIFPPKTDAVYDEFSKLSKDKQAAYHFYRGHMPYRMLAELPGNPYSLTFLRQPDAQMLSAANEARKMAVRGEYYDPSLADLSLQDFLKTPEGGQELINWQIKFFNERFFRDPQLRRQPVDRADLQTAKNRLDSFDFIGILERMDESMQLLSYQLGVPPIRTLPLLNTSRGEVLNHNILRKLHDLNELDWVFYHYAEAVFEDRLQSMYKNLAAGRDNLPEPAEEFTQDMTRIYPGQNWYYGEQNPDHGLIRWSGPGNSSHLYACLLLGEKTVRFEIITAVTWDTLENLRFLVNGYSLNYRRKPIPDGKGYEFIVNLPAEVIQPRGWNRFTFQVPAAIPVQESTPEDPARQIGICLKSFEIKRKESKPL